MLCHLPDTRNCADFSSSNFTLQDHILNTAGDALIPSLLYHPKTLKIFVFLKYSHKRFETPISKLGRTTKGKNNSLMLSMNSLGLSKVYGFESLMTSQCYLMGALGMNLPSINTSPFFLTDMNRKSILIEIKSIINFRILNVI